MVYYVQKASPGNRNGGVFSPIKKFGSTKCIFVLRQRFFPWQLLQNIPCLFRPPDWLRAFRFDEHDLSHVYDDTPLPGRGRVPNDDALPRRDLPQNFRIFDCFVVFFVHIYAGGDFSRKVILGWVWGRFFAGEFGFKKLLNSVIWELKSIMMILLDFVILNFLRV